MIIGKYSCGLFTLLCRCVLKTVRSIEKFILTLNAMAESIKVVRQATSQETYSSEAAGRSFAPPTFQLTASAPEPSLPEESSLASPLLQLREEPKVEEFKGQDVNKTGRVSCPKGEYNIASSEGVKLRNKPNGVLSHSGRVKYNTEVRVRCLDNTGAFYFVVPLNGSPAGWINKDYVATGQPEPGADLHHITESDLTTILKNHYVDTGKWSLGSGNDYTSLAAAVQSVNQGRQGISIDWEKVHKYKENHKLRGVLDKWTFDNYAIYHGSEIKAGNNIWLPSVSYIRMLQGSGAISTRPDLLNFAIDSGKGIAGFLLGVQEGLVRGIWEMVEGLWELGKGIVNTITGLLDGSLFASISEIYDKVKDFTWADAEKMVSDVVAMGSSAWSDFKSSWNHSNIYSKWNFRGIIVGKIALEVILAIFTGGASLGAKILAKVGKHFPKLMNVLNKLLKHADDIDFRNKRNRKPGDRDADRDHKNKDKDESNSDREWEQTRMLASVIVEAHDKKNTPVEALIPMLNFTFAAKSKSVTRYDKRPNGDGSYKILQLAKRNVVDEHYTDETKDENVPATGLSVIRQGTKQWNQAVSALRNLSKGKLDFAVETASDAKELLTQARGNMNRYKQYSADKGITYKKGYEVHNDQNAREIGVGNDLQHLKWKDGKAGGHIYFNKPN